MRFIAQVARTGAADQIFGQLVGAFEMAKKSNLIVAANLSSPEDDSASITNYDLHMAMLDFLHTKYAGVSPLHVTLHAGELVPAYLPAEQHREHVPHPRGGRDRSRRAHRSRHRHHLGDRSDGLMDEMAANHVLVEVCLSSNTQILAVSGADHPLAQYLAHGVPVALATDDQGVSRSSMAGEYMRAALDQTPHVSPAQDDRARLAWSTRSCPATACGRSLGTPVAACAATATMGIGDRAERRVQRVPRDERARDDAVVARAQLPRVREPAVAKADKNSAT